MSSVKEDNKTSGCAGCLAVFSGLIIFCLILTAIIRLVWGERAFYEPSADADMRIKQLEGNLRHGDIEVNGMRTETDEEIHRAAVEWQKEEARGIHP
jgi:hypothetical protein